MGDRTKNDSSLKNRNGARSARTWQEIGLSEIPLEPEPPAYTISNIKDDSKDDEFPVFVSFDRETRQFWIWFPVPSGVKIWMIVFFTVKLEVVYSDGKKKKIDGEKRKPKTHVTRSGRKIRAAPIRIQNGIVMVDGKTIYIDSTRGDGRWALPNRVIDQQYWLPPGSKSADYKGKKELGWRTGDFPMPDIDGMRGVLRREKKKAPKKKVKYLKLTIVFDIYIFLDVDGTPGVLLAHVIVQVTITFSHKKKDAQRDDTKKEERRKEASLGWKHPGGKGIRGSGPNEWFVTKVTVIKGKKDGKIDKKHKKAWDNFKGDSDMKGVNGYKPPDKEQ